MKDKRKNLDSNEYDLQDDIYASFNTETEEINDNSSNVNLENKQQPHYQEKQYPNNYLESHTVVTRASKASKVVLFGFYFLFAVVAVVVFFMLRADRYEFYLVKDEVSISNGSDYQVELTPKHIRYFSYLNYDYEIEDENVAIVDEFGTVKAINPGTTTLKISLSPGLTSKKMTIRSEDILIESISLLLNKDNDLKKVSTINMKTNQTYTLKAIANNRKDLSINVEYSSSNRNVAIIDEYGNVTAVGAGTTTIIGTKNGVKGSVVVKVTQDSSPSYSAGYTEHKVTGVKLNVTSMSLIAGESRAMEATVLPANADNNGVIWTSSNTKVVAVSKYGVVTGISEGSATITVTTVDGSKKAICQITVSESLLENIGVTGVELNKTELSIDLDESTQLISTVSPAKAINKKVTWSSSDKDIVTVSDTGVVTAKKAGTATITVTTEDGKKTASCTVKVTVPIVSVTGVKLNKSTLSLEVGGKETLSATVSPAKATNKDLIWSSSNKRVATVSDTGVVNAINSGKTTITVATQDGNKEATCEVTVNKSSGIKVTEVKIDAKGVLKKKINETITLSATVSPNDASDKGIKWSSKDTKVAKVDSNGKVTAVGYGETTITVTTDDGGKTDSIQIQVSNDTPQAPAGTQVNVNAISLSTTSLTITRGKTATFDVKMKSATGKIKVSSSDTNIVEVVVPSVITSSKVCNEKNGECALDAYPGEGEVGLTYTVKAIKSGTAYINITCENITILNNDLEVVDTLNGSGKVGILVK